MASAPTSPRTLTLLFSATSVMWIASALAYLSLALDFGSRSTVTSMFHISIVLAGILGLSVVISVTQRIEGLGHVPVVSMAFVAVGVAISGIAWGSINVYLLIQGIGYAIFAYSVLRSGQLRTPGTVLVGTAFFAGPAGFIVANAANVGATNQYGDRDLSFAIGLALSAVLMATGLAIWNTEFPRADSG